MPADIASLDPLFSISGGGRRTRLRGTHLGQHFIEKRSLPGSFLSSALAVPIVVLVEAGLAGDFLDPALGHPGHYMVQQQATTRTIIVNHFTQTNLISRHGEHLREEFPQETNGTNLIIYGVGTFQKQK